MYEKVSPEHPDKIADRIAGAIVDEAYRLNERPRIAVEVLIGHGECHIIAETSEHIKEETVANIVKRIAGNVKVDYKEYQQDKHLADNQSERIKSADNGIFKGTEVTREQMILKDAAKFLYRKYGTDGKYLIDEFGRLIICQSNAKKEDLESIFTNNAIINPLGDWTGGTDVDTGATNRKLGSDMGDSVTGGGLHGKDLSKADVSVNVFAFLKAQELGRTVELHSAIGDDQVSGIPYEEIVKTAKEYIDSVGGFEKFAEWGLIR